MKSLISIISITSILVSCISYNGTVDTWDAMGIDYSPREQFSSSELRDLATNPDEDSRRLMWLINRAAAEKDGRFQDLLSRKDLRTDPKLDLSLANYDYSLNGNEESLDYILAKDDSAQKGGDTITILVMSFMEEWDRTINAIREHQKQADGAGGIAVACFWMNRQELFPVSYRRYLQKTQSDRHGLLTPTPNR